MCLRLQNDGFIGEVLLVMAGELPKKLFVCAAQAFRCLIHMDDAVPVKVTVTSIIRYFKGVRK